MANIKINELPNRSTISDSDLIMVGDNLSGELYKSKYINLKNTYVTPEQFGAVGDGISDDKNAIQDAIDSGYPVYLNKKRYFISGSIELPEGAFLKGTGTGELTNIYITANDPAFIVKGSNINIESLSILGSGEFTSSTYSSTKPNQHGISVAGTTDFLTQYQMILISNCTFYGLSGAGIHTTYNVGANNSYSGGVQAINCVAYACYIGYFNDVRGEYNQYVGCKAQDGSIGYRNAGGNNVFVGGILSNNYSGVYLTNGANNSHSYISSSAINHNAEYGIWTNGVTLGYTITDCAMYDNDIFIDASQSIRFINNDISCNAVYVKNSTNTIFVGNVFATTPVFELAFGGTPNDVQFFNNKFIQTEPTGIQLNRLLNSLSVTNIATFADDSAAGSGGLISGDFYKTATGELRIKI